MSRHKIKKCIICHKTYDETFYDKGSGGTERYLCSKKCYEKIFNESMEREIEELKKQIANELEINNIKY